jgi:outer membrane beta-barrel protein
MKNVKTLLVLSLIFGSLNAFAASDVALTDQLGELKLPENTAPVGLRSERLYSVQSRDTDLAHRFEFDLGGAKNFTGNGFLTQTQVDATIRYHLTNRWDLSVSGAYGYNSFTDSANLLMKNNSILPDAAVVKERFDALLGYNLFYGKFRMNMDNVFYFDQYVAVGPGAVTTQFQTALAAVADVGFALNFGNSWTARFGAKNDFYNEQTANNKSLAYHLLGHVDVGYLIGGESHYE